MKLIILFISVFIVSCSTSIKNETKTKILSVSKNVFTKSEMKEISKNVDDIISSAIKKHHYEKGINNIKDITVEKKVIIFNRYYKLKSQNKDVILEIAEGDIYLSSSKKNDIGTKPLDGFDTTKIRVIKIDTTNEEISVDYPYKRGKWILDPEMKKEIQKELIKNNISNW